MCTTASLLCRLVFYFHIGAIFSVLSAVYVCDSRAQRKTIFMCLKKFLTSITRSFFLHLQVDQKRDLLSSCDRSECVWRKIFAIFFNVCWKTSTLCRRRRLRWHYICRILCVKKEGKATMTNRNWKSTKNARDRLMFKCS